MSKYRLFICIVMLGTVPAQTVDVFPLSVWETERLIRLSAQESRLKLEWLKAQKELCEAEELAKSTRKLREAKRVCGVMVVNDIRWAFDKHYKYLINVGAAVYSEVAR